MHTPLFPRQSYLHCALHPQEKLVFEQILHKLSSLFTELDLGLVFAHLCPTNFLHQNHRLQLNTSKLLFCRGLATSRILHQKQTLYTGSVSRAFIPQETAHANIGVLGSQEREYRTNKARGLL